MLFLVFLTFLNLGCEPFNECDLLLDVGEILLFCGSACDCVCLYELGKTGAKIILIYLFVVSNK